MVEVWRGTLGVDDRGCGPAGGQGGGGGVAGGQKYGKIARGDAKTKKQEEKKRTQTFSIGLQSGRATLAGKNSPMVLRTF